MAVRREEVRIHVTSNLGSVAARDAAGVNMLASNLDRLGGTAVESDRATQRMNRSLSQTSSAVSGSDGSIRRQSDTINQLTGRIRVLADVAAILGPALAPIGALAVPAVAGLANQLGFAAAAAGTAVLAFQGVGDAVGAMNEFALEPSAENAQKVQEALAKLSPEAAKFAREISGMRDQFAATRDAAAEGLFGGLTPALDDLDGLLGRVQPILREIGAATGDMLADGLGSLNSDRWQPFFDFLQAEARPVLTELGETVGDFGHGLAELWMAFQPLNRDFGSWMADVASSFDDWAAGIGQTEGFQDFIAYIRESGPQVASAMGALGGALVDIVSAAAPLGGPVLAGIEGFANVVSAIADSPLGPMLVTAAAGMALFNRAMAVGTRVAAGGFFATTAANARRVGPAITSASQAAARGIPTMGQFGTAAYRLGQSTKYASEQTLAARGAVGAFLGSAGRVALPMAGLALATSEAGQEMEFANTATYGLIGAMAGLPGVLGGATLGAAMDFAEANNDVADAMERAQQIANNGSIKDMEAEYRRVGTVLDEQSGKFSGFFNDVSSTLSQAAGKLTGGFIGDEDAAKVNDLRNEYDSLAGSIRRAQNPMSGLAGLLTGPFNESRGAINGAATSIKDFIAQTARLGRVLSGESALIDYEQGLDDLAASLKENGKNFDYNTQAGRDNGRAFINASSNAIEFSKTLKGFERIEFLRSVRTDLKGMVGEIPGAKRLFQQVDDQLKRLGGRWAKPKVEPQGVKKSQKDISGLDDLVTQFGNRKAAPKIDPDTRAGKKTIQGMDNRFREMDRRRVRPRVEPDISRAQRSLGNMRGRLDEIGSQRVRPTLDANDRPAMNKLRALNAANRRFNGSRWRSNLDLNDAPAARKLSGANRGMSRFAGLTARGTADVNDGPAQTKLRGVDSAMKRTGGLKATTNVDANTAGANNNLSGHASYLSSINGRTSSTYVNNYITTIRRERVERASGGLVTSGARARGLVRGPGTSTSDSIDARLSDGEYVQRTKAVNYYGVDLMNQMNDMRIDRRALVEAASRSGSQSVNVNVNSRVRGFLETSDGQRVDLTTIEDIVDQRMLDWDRDDFSAIHGRG